MPAGWYDDPFTDHLQRYWTGDSWTKETRPRPGVAEPPPAYPAPHAPPVSPGEAASVPNYLIPSIIALLCCAWPLAIPALVFSVKANSAKNSGDVQTALVNARRARLWIILSAIVGIVVWVYLSYVIATTDVPTDQGTLTPFGASAPWSD